MDSARTETGTGTKPPLSPEMRAMLENRLRALQQEEAGIKKMLGQKKKRFVTCPGCGMVIEEKR